MKYKIGDEVRCIGPFVNHGINGFGWKEGRVFTISEITNENTEGWDAIYWRGESDGGVYEKYLELTKVDNWKKRLGK